MRFENEVPDEFRTDGIEVHTVGELIDALARLPRDLPVCGLFCVDVINVGVTHHIASENEEYLALVISDVFVPLEDDGEDSFYEEWGL